MPNLDVKDAIRIAKDFVLDALADEEPVNVGLEEIEYSEADADWLVTIGFSRPWNRAGGFTAAATGDWSYERAYRVLRVDDRTGSVKSMSLREMAQ